MIALTVYSNREEDVKDVCDSGMKGHLAKPIEIGVLYTMLKNLFGQ